MNAIFLAKSEQMLRSVYCGDTYRKIMELAGAEDIVYTKEDLLAEPEKFRDVRYLFSTWGMAVLTEEEIRTCLPRLEAVFYGAGSVRHFAPPLLNCGVRLFSAWGANAVPVAEFAFAQITLANKGYFMSTRIERELQHAGAADYCVNFPGNYDAVVGIVGAGMIGKMVMEKLKALRVKVLVFDAFLSAEEIAALGGEKVSLEELFRRCNVVSNHLANNEQTRGMMRYEHFASMPPYATFINTARGPQLIQPDLFRALKERPDLTALIDVTAPEPAEPDSPYYTLPNCFLSPHIAGSKGNENARMGEYMLEEFRGYLEGRPSRYEVTMDMLRTMA